MLHCSEFYCFQCQMPGFNTLYIMEILEMCACVDVCCVTWVCICVYHFTCPPPHSRLMYTPIMEMMCWKVSSLVSGNRNYIALRSSSAWWNKLLNISLQLLRTYTRTRKLAQAHTHKYYPLTGWYVCQHSADTHIGFHSLYFTICISQNPTKVLLSTVNPRPFELELCRS